MTTAPSCVFCAILEGKLPARMVYEDEHHVAFLPLEHINPGHVLLVPRAHTDYLFDLEPAAYERLWAVASRLAGPMRDALQAKRIGVAVEGFNVPHVHVHLVPLNAVDELTPVRAQTLPSEEADRLAARLRAALMAGR